jgi:hypothetical protein
MRKTIFMLVLLLASSVVLAAQSRQFTRDGIDYILELPTPAWQVVSRLDVHDHPEFINGNDPTNGYLRIRKLLVDRGTTTTDLFSQDEKWELRRLPGYVACSECEGIRFGGQLRGAVFSYEYVAAGRTMYGRIYYLEVDPRTYYSLRFTVSHDKLQVVRAQMDLIAQSFRMKQR